MGPAGGTALARLPGHQRSRRILPRLGRNPADARLRHRRRGHQGRRSRATGAVTPYALLDPVLLAGSTISMATLHNAEDIARKDIREGDRVLVEKAGDVIPKIVKVILPDRPVGPRRDPWRMPATCPECGSSLHRDE